MNTVAAFIGLGGNMERPLRQLWQAAKALRGLPHSRLSALSAVYQSPAIGPPQPDYLNAVCCLQTQLAPLELLALLQQQEQIQCRRRDIRWGPRTLDLDLLLYADLRIAHPDLCLPHPEIERRAFVWWPLSEIASERIAMWWPHLRIPPSCPAPLRRRISQKCFERLLPSAARR